MILTQAEILAARIYCEPKVFCIQCNELFTLTGFYVKFSWNWNGMQLSTFSDQVKIAQCSPSSRIDNTDINVVQRGPL
jgi:hypothetical protein